MPVEFASKPTTPEREVSLNHMLHSKLLDAIRQHPRRQHWFPHMELVWQEYLEKFEADSPELLDLISETKTDGFHGSTSASIPNVIKHGLISPEQVKKNHRDQPLGVEHSSDGSSRGVVHVVPWMYVSNTALYAEDKVTGKGNKFVNPQNYQDFSDMDDSRIEEMDKTIWPYHYMKGMKAESLIMKSIMESGVLTKEQSMFVRDYFPVVWGVRTNKINKEDIHFNESFISGDCSVDGRIDEESITGLWCPEDRMQVVSDYLSSQDSDMKIFSLEQLRTAPESPIH